MFVWLGASSCSPAAVQEPANRIAYNGFESVEGWGPAQPALTAEQAHSGRFSTKVDGNIEFSIGYFAPLGKTGLLGTRKLKVRGWVRRFGNGSTPALVVQVLDPAHENQQVFWEGYAVEKQSVTYNRWMLLEKTFELPATCTESQELRVYLWRDKSTQPTYLDDIELVRE